MRYFATLLLLVLLFMGISARPVQERRDMYCPVQWLVMNSGSWWTTNDCFTQWQERLCPVTGQTIYCLRNYCNGEVTDWSCSPF